ncbi:MAG: cytochrome c [Pyrinomonadaceae bacterium]
MTTTRIKLIGAAVFSVGIFAVLGFNSEPVVTSAAAPDAAATYKAQCAMCHTPTAAKFFDPAKADAEHVETILKGKKGEKPPYMPGFEAKGMTADDAKALAEYMRGLRTPKT